MNSYTLKSVHELHESLLNHYDSTFKKLFTQPIYIFGAKQLGKQSFDSCSKLNLSILGFIDSDPKKQGTQYCGLPVYSVEEINKEQEPCIILASVLYQATMKDILLQHNITSFIEYHILPFYNDSFPQHPMYKNLFEDITKNKEHYLSLQNMLSDKKSCDIFNDLVQYRLDLNTKHLREAYVKSEKTQYFLPNYMSFTTQDVFVDGGGYDGQTTKDFISLTNGNYKKIYYFEPDSHSFEKSKHNLASLQNIELFQKGLFSHKDTLFFSMDHTEGSKIQDSGTLTVETVSLDECITEPISFIKFDIEGAEYSALLGAKKHIQEDHPILAICIYHSPEDFWKIPLLIKDILEENIDEPYNTHYNFYLQHHLECIMETVFYAIPKKSSTICDEKIS